MNSTIDILCSIDSHFEMQFFVTLCSLFDSNPHEHFHVHLITVDVPAKQQDRMETWVTGKQQDISFYAIPDELRNTDLIPQEGYFTISTYMRCFITKVLPPDIHRILYIDCDILVNSSISKLWATDLEGKAIGAVDDMWALKGNGERLGYDSKYSYFNAGVLLINLDYWREHDTYHQSLAFIKAHKNVLQFHDQDILNGLFHNSRKELHPCYNMQDTFFRYKRKFVRPDVLKQVDECIDTPVIIHFTGGHKPWHYKCYHPWRKVYLAYIEKTPYKGFKLPKGKFSDILEVHVNPILWSLGLLKRKYRKVRNPR